MWNHRLALLVALGFSLSPAALVAGIHYEPLTPTGDDPLRILVSGTWRDSCVPQPVATAVRGEVVQISSETTDVGGCFSAVTLEIVDPVGGVRWSYTNPLGERSRAVADTRAFACGT